MSIQSNRPSRRIHLLMIRLGLAGFLVLAFGVSLASFALFGCYCRPQMELMTAPEDTGTPEPFTPVPISSDKAPPPTDVPRH